MGEEVSPTADLLGIHMLIRIMQLFLADFSFRLGGKRKHSQKRLNTRYD